MSSDSPQPEPSICPHCHQPLPKGLPRPTCPECGTSLVTAVEKQAEATPLSPFDDLFDEQGAPSWGSSASGANTSFEAQEPLEFPEEVDPFGLTGQSALKPLEGESKELFDFGARGNVGGNSSSDQAASQTPGQASVAEVSQVNRTPAFDAGAVPSEPALAPLPFDDETPTSGSELDLGEMPKLDPVFHSSGSRDDDPNLPLRIEGLESENPSGDLATVRCRICDSLVYIQPSQLGTTVKCPECYSEILAEQAAPRRSSNTAFQPMQADSYVLNVEPPVGKFDSEAEGEYRLSEPVERPKVDIPSHYGLEPEKEDLLAPQQPLAKQSPASPKVDSSVPTKPELPKPTSAAKQAGTRAERWQEPAVAGPKAEPLDKKATNSGEKNQSTSQATPGKLPPFWQQKPTQPEPVAEDSSGTKLEIGLEELTAPGVGILNWLTIMAQDAWFWVCFGIATLTLGFGYWCFDQVSHWLGTAGEKKLGAIVSSVFLGIPGLAAFLCGMAITVIVSALFFHLGGRKQPKLSDWKGYNFNDWAPAVGFVSFAFALAALPGLLLGILVALLTGSTTALPILIALSVALLAPLFAIGVCRSDSPFGVFDSKVFKLFSFEDVDWLKYLPGSLAAFFLFLIGTLFLLLNGLIWSTIGAAAQVAGWAIFGSLTGLYSGLIVEKVNQNESKP